MGLQYTDVDYAKVHETVQLIARVCENAQVPVTTLFGASLMLVYIIGSQKATIDYDAATAFTKEMSEWVGLRLQDPQGSVN